MAARQAGRKLASTATEIRIIGPTAKVARSVAFIANRRLDSNRVASRAPATPKTVPARSQPQTLRDYLADHIPSSRAQRAIRIPIS